MLLEDNASTEPFFRCCSLSRDFCTHTQTHTIVQNQLTHIQNQRIRRRRVLLMLRHCQEKGTSNKEEEHSWKKKKTRNCCVLCKSSRELEALFFAAGVDFERLSKCFHGSLASIWNDVPGVVFWTPVRNYFRFCHRGRGGKGKTFLILCFLLKD